MANSSDAQDHNFGVVEAAVKETARGRAFLADYARKVRQSDTLTMLAMIGRLERWCQDQAVRLAEIEGRDFVGANRAPLGHASLAAIPGGRTTEQMIGGGEASLHANHLGISPVTVSGQDSPSVDRTSDDTADEIVGVGQSREAMDRIGHLANRFRDLDRRVADLTGHYRVAVQFKDRGLPAPVDSVGNGMGTMISHSAAPDAKPRFSPDTAGKTHPVEEDVLDGIARALGTSRISSDHREQ
jgi:hypothetical protein